MKLQQKSMLFWITPRTSMFVWYLVGNLRDRLSREGPKYSIDPKFSDR